MNLRETIARAIAETAICTDCAMDEVNAGDIADAVLRAITEAGCGIVASLPAWAILPNDMLIERMGGRSLDPLP